MNTHITQDNLIKYQFGLATEQEAHAIAFHLENCSDCRNELEKLKVKFAPLDLLKDEIAVPQELFERTVKQTQTNVTRKILLKPAWLVAAAVAMVLGASALVSLLPPRSLPPTGDSNPPETAIAKVEAIDETPPFAPASAIELNVLPRRDSLQLTIYNSADLTLVREQRQLTIKRGWNWLQFMWANTLIDPTSLTLEPLENQDKIEVQQLVYPARLKDIGRWLIRSEVEGQVPVEITYMTSGLSWRAFYQGTLTPDESKLHWQGYVRVDNQSGEDYENAQTRLIVGQVHQLDRIIDLARRDSAHGRPGPDIIADKDGRDRYHWAFFDDGIVTEGIQSNVDYLGDFAAGIKKIEKEGLSEYFLYTIEGTETIENQWARRLPSFEAENIPVESLYKYDEQRWGNAPIRFLTFNNDTDHKLGATPIPDGAVEIFRNTDDGHLAYVGRTAVKYIPVNNKIELDLGPARAVKVEPVLMKHETANYQFNKNMDITGFDQIETWKVNLTNTRNIPVKLEIYRNFETSYWDIANSGPSGDYEKEDMDTAKYTLTLEPESKKEFQYVLTMYQGTRQQNRKE